MGTYLRHYVRICILKKCFQIFNISSCEVCPGGCGSNVRIPILCPPVLGEPSCICQHPDGVINLTPYANITGNAMYACFTMLHLYQCNNIVRVYMYAYMQVHTAGWEWCYLLLQSLSGFSYVPLLECTRES